MPAYSEEFPWPSYYGNFNFFESLIQGLDKVKSINHTEDGLYEIVRTRGDILYVFICECYSFGISEYIETKDNFEELNAIIIASNWCNYSADAKDFCRDNAVGLFNIREFMGALNQNDYWRYLTKEEKEYQRKHGKP